jgi:hypothetical protein
VSSDTDARRLPSMPTYIPYTQPSYSFHPSHPVRATLTLHSHPPTSCPSCSIPADAYKCFPWNTMYPLWPLGPPQLYALMNRMASVAFQLTLISLSLTFHAQTATTMAASILFPPDPTEVKLQNRLLNEVNSTLNSSFKSNHKSVKSNGAIASAISSYSRIHTS